MRIFQGLDNVLKYTPQEILFTTKVPNSYI